jgi:DNA-binding transcriptional ArsR family regulator
MQPNITIADFLIGDPARAAMLVSLLDGCARPAGQLAHMAGVTAQTASSHLAKLLQAGLVSVETEERHRYRLAGLHVALALESLASISPSQPIRREVLIPEA